MLFSHSSLSNKDFRDNGREAELPSLIETSFKPSMHIYPIEWRCLIILLVDLFPKIEKVTSLYLYKVSYRVEECEFFSFTEGEDRRPHSLIHLYYYNSGLAKHLFTKKKAC